MPTMRRMLAVVGSIRTRSVFLSSALATLLLIGARELGALKFLNLAAYDLMVQSLPPRPADSRLLVVAISESDIKGQKQWPLPDQTLAQLLATLQQYQPTVIGLDLHRDIPQPPGHAELVKQLKRDNIIAIEKIAETGDDSVPPPPTVPQERVGFNDLLLDEDNVVRRSLLYTEIEEQQFHSFALRLSLRYLRDAELGREAGSRLVFEPADAALPRDFSLRVEPDALQIGHATFRRLHSRTSSYSLSPPETLGWQLPLKYRSPEVARQVTLTQVLQGELDPSWVKDKIVLIGTTAPSIKDLYATPYSLESENFLIPGVTIHAQIASQILSAVLEGERQLWFWTEWQEWLWLWLWSAIGGIITWRSGRSWEVILTVAMALGVLWLACFGLLQQSAWVPLVAPSLGLIGTTAAVLSYRLRYNWLYDSLTELPNRRLFAQQLERAAAQQRSSNPWMAVLFLDLVRLKILNDGLGREAGDYLLLQAAQQLQELLSREARLARVSGGEFGIWLPSVVEIEDAVDVAQRLKEALTRSVFWKGHDIPMTVNVGIAIRQLGQDFQAEEWLRHADIALYRAKRSGRTEVFAPDMRRQVEGRWQLETDLRKAISREEFQLYYQPIVSLQTADLMGFEALVRWQSPDRGLVSPGEFIPLAEETGLIVPMGQWILLEACRQLRDWQMRFPDRLPLILSVNLSTRQFAQLDLSDQIQKILQGFGIPGGCLKLEITESTMIDDVEAAIVTLKELKALGLQLSIDDFGTGYSSLSYLHRFPIDTLKIDRAFVSRIDEVGEEAPYTQIVRTIVTLGHNLRLQVIAEGIETERQMEVLQALGCEYGQGYFFGKPMPREAATALLSGIPPWQAQMKQVY